MLDVTFIANYKNALNFVNASYVKKKPVCSRFSSPFAFFKTWFN